MEVEMMAKAVELVCKDTNCGSVLEVVSVTPEKVAVGVSLVEGRCPRCARRYTAEIVVILKEGEGPHHEGPEEMNL